MEPIRIALVGLPRMLREIVREIVARDRDVTVAGEFDNWPDAIDRLRRRPCEIAIGDLAATGRIGVDRLLETCPRIIAVSSDARRSVLYELSSREEALGELSADRLLEAIRGDGRC